MGYPNSSTDVVLRAPLRHNKHWIKSSDPNKADILVMSFGTWADNAAAWADQAVDYIRTTGRTHVSLSQEAIDGIPEFELRNQLGAFWKGMKEKWRKQNAPVEVQHKKGHRNRVQQRKTNVRLDSSVQQALICSVATQ